MLRSNRTEGHLRHCSYGEGVAVLRRDFTTERRCTREYIKPTVYNTNHHDPIAMVFTEYEKRRMQGLSNEGMRTPNIARLLRAEGVRASLREVLFPATRQCKQPELHSSSSCFCCHGIADSSCQQSCENTW